jgi:ubiquinone/menaquinone biosynthesis C-methylase UbiE
MGLTDVMARQAGKPTGRFGRLCARFMNFGHAPVTRWGLSHLSVNTKDTILDIGCGGGRTIKTLAKTATDGKVYGIDYSEDCVAVATRTNKRLIDTRRVEIIHASVESLPFPDDSFDLVTAVETTYFWPDFVGNLKEIRRVLKPRGSVLLINEMYRHDKFEKRNRKWAEAGNFAYHLPAEFEQFLRAAGYASIQIDVVESKNWITAMGTKKGN